MGNKSLAKVVSLLAALAMTAAACGSDSGAAGDTGDTTTTAADNDTDTTEASDDSAAADGTVEAAPSCTGESNGILEIGGLLPQTGNLAYLGPPEEAGAALAIKEINEAGGVLGENAVFMPGDSSDNGDVANQTVDRHLSGDVDAILGAASSGVTFTVIDKVTGACKIQFSSAATSPDFTEYDEGELFFRTSPSDVLQGRVLADLIIQEGSTTVGLMALQDPYGEGLLNYTKLPLEEQGAEIVTDFVYDPKAQSFDAEVQQMVTADPEAIVLIGFDESASILTGLFEAGFTPDVKKIYLVDGNIGNATGLKFAEEGVLNGIKGTLPSAEITDDFKDRMLEIDPGLIDYNYGPETYDAVMVMALAAEAAGTDDPAAIAAKINGITRDGEKCTTFAECRDLIAAGTDIDYDGPSGPLTFGPAGELTEANFTILSYGGDVTDDANGNVNEIDDSQNIYLFAQL